MTSDSELIIARAERVPFCRYRARTALIWVMFGGSFFVIYAFTIWLPTLYVQVGGLPPTESLLLTAINGSAGA